MTSWPIAFEAKDFLGVLLVLASTALATAALLISQRCRELALAAIGGGAVLTEKLDINFYSAYWYRGTTRGFEVTFVDVLAWALLCSTVLAPRHGRERLYWPAGLGPMLLFGLAAGVSVMMGSPQVFGWYELSKLVRGLAVFLAAAYFVRRERDRAILVLSLSAAVLLEGATAVRQRMLEGVFRATGTLDHPNSLSMYLCLVAPVLLAASASDLARPVRWIGGAAVAVAAVTVLLTLSRAGIPAFAIVVGGTAWRAGLLRFTPRNVVAAAIAGVAVAVMVTKSWDLLMARYQSASLEEEYFDTKGEGRGYYFRQAGIVLAEEPYGVGLGNWSYWVSKKYGARAGMRYEDYDDIAFPPPNDLLPMYRHAAPAHNLGVLTAGEIGWAGLGVFALVWLRWFHLGAGFLRGPWAGAGPPLGAGIFFGCAGVFLQSFTEWTFRQTQIFLTFHVLVGTLAGLQRERRNARGAAAAPQCGTEPELAVAATPGR